MKGKRYAEEQIAFALRQAESGVPAVEVCRKMGVPEKTFYAWKKKNRSKNAALCKAGLTYGDGRPKAEQRNSGRCLRRSCHLNPVPADDESTTGRCLTAWCTG
jgi:transposase-like protein